MVASDVHALTIADCRVAVKRVSNLLLASEDASAAGLPGLALERLRTALHLSEDASRVVGLLIHQREF